MLGGLLGHHNEVRGHGSVVNAKVKREVAAGR
jgi:hypothetical protein